MNSTPLKPTSKSLHSSSSSSSSSPNYIRLPSAPYPPQAHGIDPLTGLRTNQPPKRRVTPPSLINLSSLRKAQSLNQNPVLISEAAIKERTGWQMLLNSVLSGDVIKSHMRNLSYSQQADQGYVLSFFPFSLIIKESTREDHWTSDLSQFLHLLLILLRVPLSLSTPLPFNILRYQVWLGIRSLLHRRSILEERRMLETARAEADSILESIPEFEITYSPTAPSPFDQVVSTLNQVEHVESLYPTRKMLIQDKPIYASLAFQYNIEALNSWLAITNSLKIQSQILKAWTGSEDLLISKADTTNPPPTPPPPTASSLSMQTSANTAVPPLASGRPPTGPTSDSTNPLDSKSNLNPPNTDTSPFIARLLKESGIKNTLSNQILSVLRGLLSKTKHSMVNNAVAFQKMGLPRYSDELRQLACFPANLMAEFLKVRLEYIEKLQVNELLKGRGTSNSSSSLHTSPHEVSNPYSFTSLSLSSVPL